jgi:hypothetical protein
VGIKIKVQRYVCHLNNYTCEISPSSSFLPPFAFQCPQCARRYKHKGIINLYAPEVAVPNNDLEKVRLVAFLFSVTFFIVILSLFQFCRKFLI